MPAGAPRRPSCAWRGIARGAGLAAGLWLAEAAAAQVVTGATYVEPTDAYPHGVLGDALEWAAVEVTIGRKAGREGGLLSGQLALTYRIDADPDTVFEDIAPRLWDVTGDGEPEVVLVQSHQAHGARLLILGLRDGKPAGLAATPWIGTRFRWLAPVGAADLDGDGAVEIAYVDRPHLAKTLRVWRYTPEGLTEVARLPGVTNHRIGEEFITGGLRSCAGRPELVLADAGWTRIMAVSFDGASITGVPVAPFTGPDSVAAALDCRD